MANYFAQTEALMRGRTFDEALAEMRTADMPEEHARFLASHRTFPGNKPTNSILMERLTPHTLGALIAMYEHRIFTQGVVWGINSYDQWGVELGKQLASVILGELKGGRVTQDHDGSTATLLNHFIGHRRSGPR
jgi:glucose-6-phosphate isomerase